MSNFDSIIRDMIKNRKASISKIDTEKNKQIRSYGYRPELRDTFNEIIKEDPDYARRYLKATSNIAYQTDVYVDRETKQKLMYRNTFNNDSVYLNFGNGDKVLITCIDSSLVSDQYDFYSDVFIDGKKLRKKNFLELPSTKHYNFKTGARRFLIDADLFDDQKLKNGKVYTVSVVIRKEPKFNSFYTTFTVSDINKKTYFIDKELVGRYGDVIDTEDNDVTSLDNLMIFKKSVLESESKYFQISNSAHLNEYIAYVNNVKGTIGKSSIVADIVKLPTNVQRNDAYEVKSNGTYGKYTCKIGDILFALSTTEESTDDNWGRIPFDIQKKSFILDLSDDVDIKEGDVYLIINRTKHIECEFINETQFTLDEYFEYGFADASMTCPLVDKSVKVNDCYLPLPVKSSNDVEVYINGFRAINDVDYFFVNNEKGNQYIRFNGVLAPNSVVTYRNKCIDTSYNFYDKVSLQHIDTNYVRFDDKFVELAATESIVPDIDVFFSMDGFMAVPYKNEYKKYRGNFKIVKMLKKTDALVEKLELYKPVTINGESYYYYEDTFDFEPYKVVTFNGENYLPYEDSFFVEEDEIETFENDQYVKFIPELVEGRFEYVEFIEFDEKVKELIANKQIAVRGLVSLKRAVYVRYVEEYAAFKDILEFVTFTEDDSKYSAGIIDLCDKNIPICENYIEAYVGRRRVPLSEKRSIINRYFKIDKQHSTFDNIELYSEINWTDYAKTVIDMLASNEVAQNVYSQLHAIDYNATVVNSWMELVSDVGYNEIDNTNVPEIFYAKINKIELSIDNQKNVRQYSKLSDLFSESGHKMKVLGYYNDDENKEIIVDVTDHCTFSFFDNHGNKFEGGFTAEVPGDQTIVAELVIGTEEKNGVKEEIKVTIPEPVSITVVELKLENIKILTNNGYLTTDDNILENVRVIGSYENGSQKVLTAANDGLEVTLMSEHGAMYPDGYVDEIGTYIIYAACREKDDRKLVVIDSPESKMIKKLDVVPNSVIKQVDSNYIIDTSFEIYATFSNGLIQKVDNSTAKIFMYDMTDDDVILDTLVKDGSGKDKLIDGDSIQDLKLDTTYKFRISLYTKDIVIETDNAVIRTISDSEYTDVNVKLLNNPIRNNYQLVYYDNFTAKVDSNFVSRYNNDAHYYFTIKNLEDNTYLTIGQGILNDNEGVLTIASLGLSDMVILEFFDREKQELTDQLLFVVKDIVSTQISATGTFIGDIANGYEIKIDKVSLNEEYDNIDFTGSRLIDGNNNVIVEYDVNMINVNNNTTRNSTNEIFIYFTNFKTKSGNVMKINNYITNAVEAGKTNLDLYFEIPEIKKIIELEVPKSQYDKWEIEAFNWEKLTIANVTVDSSTYEDEKWLVIEPEIPEDVNIVKVLELRPNTSYVTDISDKGFDIMIQLRNSSISGSQFETILDILRSGINRYCYIADDSRIFYIDINIAKHDTFNVAIVDSVNDDSIKLIAQE